MRKVNQSAWSEVWRKEEREMEDTPFRKAGAILLVSVPATIMLLNGEKGVSTCERM